MKRCVLGFVCYILVTVSSLADSYTNTLPAGPNFIANQLDHGSNTFTELFPNADGSRDGDVIQLYGCTNYVTYNFDSSSPTGFTGPDDATPVPPGVLAPGQGAIYYNEQGATETITFVGTPHVQVLPIALPCGLGQTNFLSRPTKGLGTYENVTGYLPQAGAIVQTWNGVSFEDYFFTGGAWSPGEPVLPVGQSAFFIVPFGSVPVPNYNLNLQAGYNLIANQLDQGGNTLAEILPAVPDGSVIYKYNNTNATWSGASYNAATGAWTPSTLALNPGEGAFFQSPTNFTVSITGTPHVPVPPLNIPNSATYMLSRQTNDVGSFENIVGTYPPEETAIYQWDAFAQQYVTNQFLFGVWTPALSEPALAVGESAWISTSGEPPPAIAVAPIILVQPTNLMVQLGDPATFAVTVASAAPPSYQWLFNSFPIPGATNSSFTIASVQTNNEGVYKVVISNPSGLVTSTPGTLTNSELVVSESPNGSNCCWTFGLSQFGGGAGDITSITATLVSSGVQIVSDSGPIGAPPPTFAATSATFFTPGTNGLNANFIEVTVCFNNVPATGAVLVFQPSPVGQPVSITLTGYSGCNSVGSVTTNAPGSSNCCVNKTWNLGGPLPYQDYSFDDPDAVVPCVTNVSPEPFWPSARYGQAMVYHAQTEVLPGPCLLLFGGADANGVPNNETWLWNGLWTPSGCKSTIPPRCFHAMAYDPTNEETVLFGGLGTNGLTNDTWQWSSISSAGQWTPITPANSPPGPRQGHAMVYDPNSGAIVLFGGLDTNGFLGDTWTWNDPFWFQQTIPGPSARQGHSMVYDPNIGAIVLVGGTDANGVQGDMWTLTYTLSGGYVWSQMASNAVPPRTGHGMAYDSGCADIVVYGGFDTNGDPLADTWEFSDSTQAWSPAPHGTPGPPARGATSAAYYPLSLSDYVFGGNTRVSSTTNFAANLATSPINDLYGFNFNPHLLNNGVASNYFPCTNLVTGPLWQRSLNTVKFSWYSTGGWLGFKGNHSFTYQSYIETDYGNTLTSGNYPSGGGTYDQYAADSGCNDTFAGPRFDCTAGIGDSSQCYWSDVQAQLFQDYALLGDFCPGLNLEIDFFDSPNRGGKPEIGFLQADNIGSPFADSVFPDPCGSTQSYHVNLQYSDPSDPPPLGGSLRCWLSDRGKSPSKVNLQWSISKVGVGTAIGGPNPCSDIVGNEPCSLAYFEYDQTSGTELRFKARVAGSLLDPSALADEGGMRLFTFYIDADNNTNTGDLCCFDLGADYYVQLVQTNSADGSHVITTSSIYQWNACATNGVSCGPGAWIQMPNRAYNLEVRGSDIQVWVPLGAVGDPHGVYAAWVVSSAPFNTNACPMNSLPTSPCSCKMVLTRVVDTNCPYVVSIDTSAVTVSNTLSAPITITFNKAMSVINPSDITMSPAQPLNTYLVGPGNNTLHIRPASGAWAPGSYTVTVLTSAKDASGNNLCNPYTFSFCVPDLTFYTTDENGNPKNVFNQGDNIYVIGCGFVPTSAVTLYLVTLGNVNNSGSLLADWTTTGSKRLTADAGGCLPMPTLIGMAAEPLEYKVVADVNNDGVYSPNIDRVTDLCGIGLQYGQPCTNVVESALAAYWPFSEASPGGPVNELYNANNGVVVGANTALVPGEVGQARTFNLLPAQPPTYVVVSNSLGFSHLLSFGNADFSIDVWVKTTQTGEAPIIDKRRFAGFLPDIFSGYYFYLLNGMPQLQIGDGNSVRTFTSTTPSVATGNWTHVAVTVDQTLFAVTNYVNGVGYAATADAAYYFSYATDNNVDLWIAASQTNVAPAPYYVGAMDELTMYRVTLSDAQVRYLYRNGTNGKCADSIAAVTNVATATATYLGNYAQFNIPLLATNLPTTYQWYTNGILVLNNPPFIFGAQSNVLTMLASSVAQSGTVFVRISNIFGYTYSSNITFNVLPITPSSTVVGFNSTWKYLANGTNPGTNWNQRGFNDSIWPSGQGLFGTSPTNVWPYPLETAIQPPALGGPITTYYRTSFQWDGGTNDVNLVTTNFIEDGAVFYINGAEAGRLRVPANQNYQTLASPQPNPGQPETIAFTVGSLLPGTNLLAVEVHQSSASASHDVFGLGLTANVSIGFVPSLTITNTGANTTVSWSGPGTLQSTPNLATPWSNLPAVSPYSAPITNGIRFYRLHVP